MRSTLTALILSIFATAAQAQGGGFTGPDNRRLVTVVEVTAMADDTNVRLVGYVIEVVGDDEYVFQDETGTIVVEIDADEWNGIDVTPAIRVELSGEIDRERDRVEIDVDAVRLAN